MHVATLIDFGSTYTKVVKVDLAKEIILARAAAESTINTDIMDGLHGAMKEADQTSGEKHHSDLVLACSSAAGGLRMIAIGLVPSLTLEASKKAALGAGAKLINSYSFELTEGEIAEIEKEHPDLVLLAGGTDGGERKVVLENSKKLAESNIECPVIFAGNKVIADELRTFFCNQQELIITPNVMPKINSLNVGPVQKAIRQVFMKRIIHAKGLDKAKKLVNEILMPTPLAVLQGAQLLAEGPEGKGGLGELMVIDVGGATTDVYSIGEGEPNRGDIIRKGLPEPYLKRTVEGDLGVRWNSRTILSLAEERIKYLLKKLGYTLSEFTEYVSQITINTGSLPQNDKGKHFDTLLAKMAVNIAFRRHAGRIEKTYLPLGEVCMQYGKDLTNMGHLIGTGGGIIFSSDPQDTLEQAVFNSDNPSELRPQKPALYLDAKYILYAIGLLATSYPKEAFAIMKKNLRPL